MSNRNNNPNPQKKYMPKTTGNPIPKPEQQQRQPTRTLSNALRNHSSAATSSSAAESRGNFVNYLPQDEAVAAGLGSAGSDPVESQRVVDHLNEHLSRLLKMNPRDFWTQVARDFSLHSFLETFLQFRSRWYDFPYRGVKGIVAGVIVGELELSKRVFMVLYRLSSNRYPGARADDILSAKDHAVLLQEKKLLDMPKLFDICSIYGYENEELTRSLVVNALEAQPGIGDDIAAALSHFLRIVHTMYERCSASLEVLLSPVGSGDCGSSRLHEDFLEVMDFINDAIVSMDSFVCAYKPAAVVFSCPVELSNGNKELLSTLSKLHDSLLPSLRRAFRLIFAAGEGGVQEKHQAMLFDVILSLKMLSMRLVKFGWNLLDICYLSEEVFQGELPLPTVSKMFPANIEDPVIRADILVQTFRENCGGYSHMEGDHDTGTFLQNIDKEHKVLDRVEFLQNTGWVTFDNQQLQYLSGIMKHPLGTNTQMNHAPTPSTSDKLQMDEDTAIAESKISQIKDLFPEYGNGFLSACLEVYNHNPEEVIQRILEGNLHPDLQSLDPTQDKYLPPKSSSIGKDNKGKGKLVDDKGKGKLDESIPLPSTNTEPKLRPQQSLVPPVLASSSQGRFMRKSTAISPDSATLDCRDERDISKISALISQLEYEDEYDDSFDDLGLSVADSGLEETELLSEKLNTNRGRPWESESGSLAPSNSSKWGSRNKPQFFVKDGKNYSYKVKDSVAVANYNEASIVNQSQKELIYGLGRGGNHPLGAVKKLTESNRDREDDVGGEMVEGRGRGYSGNFRGRGRRGVEVGGGRSNGEREGDDGDDESNNGGHSGNCRGRGRRGGGRGRSNHYRKDQAMKKHFTGVSGF